MRHYDKGIKEESWEDFHSRMTAQRRHQLLIGIPKRRKRLFGGRNEVNVKVEEDGNWFAGVFGRRMSMVERTDETWTTILRSSNHGEAGDDSWSSHWDYVAGASSATSQISTTTRKKHGLRDVFIRDKSTASH